MIIDQLDKYDLLNVSVTCKLCHDELAPIIFKTISFSNEERVCESALIAAEKYGHLTQRIQFNLHLTGTSVDMAQFQSRSLREKTSSDGYARSKHAPRLRNPVLLPSARGLLTGLHLPALQTFEIVYKITSEQLRSDSGSVVWQGNRKDSLPAERLYPWRALLAETFRAISNNQTITELVFTDLVPVYPSTFYTPAFRRLLSRIKSATFQFPRIRQPGDLSNYSDYTSCYLDFFSKYFISLLSLHERIETFKHSRFSGTR